MKLKFKADASDVVIFILFAIFLLYVVCLAVLNFPELAINGRFFGLNPFPAFAPDRILGTIVLMKLISFFSRKVLNPFITRTNNRLDDIIFIIL